MQKRKFDELISHFNRKVSDMSIDQKYKMELLGMISAIGFAHEKELGTNLAEVGKDCISRQKAIDAVNCVMVMKGIRSGKSITAEAVDCAKRIIADNIRQLPPIQPDIVRCKDCKHWIPYDWMFSEVWRSKNMADYPEDEIGCACSDMAMKANDFCSRAERRTE